MTRRLFVCFGVLIFLVGCNQLVWVKPRATAQDFANDKFECLQQSQEQIIPVYVGVLAGGAERGTVTNPELMKDCMNARGWYLELRPVVLVTPLTSPVTVTTSEVAN